MRGEPLIVVVKQPAQPLDFNICDLAFFRALGVAVRKAAPLNNARP